mgnify:CR=1 FL=1
MLESKYLKDNIQNIQKLMSIPALKHFETRNLAKILRLSKIREYDDGELIIKEGDVDPWLYFLLAGKVRVAAWPEGREPVLQVDKRGRFITNMGYANVSVRVGDGYRGWPEHAPYDAIILAAAPSHIPEPLVEQLAPGGRLVLPVGEWAQELVVVEKQADGTTREWTEIGVRFVPMTGEAQRR